MLQIDHIYEFFYSIFKNVDVHFFHQGIIEDSRYYVFNGLRDKPKFLFYDQEPLLPTSEIYLRAFVAMDWLHTDFKILMPSLRNGNIYPRGKQLGILITSEHSEFQQSLLKDFDLPHIYYFYHGFAALDWYRGSYALNYNKTMKQSYQHDFVSYNRIINNDRSYRIYWVSKLVELDLLSKGQVSFNVTDNRLDDWRDEVADPDTKLSEHARQHAERHLTDIDKLIVDRAELPGSASADIPRDIDAFWHIVAETVFYYDKLHLTEKIFKPIVSKQPFMLIAAPGNLAYLRSYGFKTFDGIIDESYDLIQDNDARIDAVVSQLSWYCNLSPSEKTRIIEAITPIVLHNFHHFYGDFKRIITQELITNTKTVFQHTGYDDQHVDYDTIYHVLTH